MHVFKKNFLLAEGKNLREGPQTPRKLLQGAPHCQVSGPQLYNALRKSWTPEERSGVNECFPVRGGT